MLNYWKSIPSWQKLLFVFCLILMLAGLAKAIYYTKQFGGADLRERIVGARMLNTNHSPYYYRWQPGDPETIINPNLNQDRNINGLSVAPGTLYVFYLFSSLPYPFLRVVWLVVQYLLLLYVFFFFFRSAKLVSAKLWLTVIATVFFFCSPFWMLHIDRGQVYILYAAFFCAIYQCAKSKSSWVQYAAGFLLAAAAYCRPTFFVLVLPFLLSRHHKPVKGFIVSSAIGICFLWVNVDLWRDYLSAMSAFAGFGGLHIAPVNHIAYPDVIEGAANLRAGKVDFMCGGLLPLYTWLRHFFSVMPSIIYVGLYAVFVAFLSTFFWKKLRKADAVIACLFGFLLYILAEYIMPAPRGAYNLVQWIFPVLLMLATERLLLYDKVLMVVGLCLTVDFPFSFPLFNAIGELLLVWTMFHFLCVYSVSPTNDVGLNDAARQNN